MAVASLDLFRETRVLERVAALEGWLRDGLEPLRSLPVVGDVRVIGGVGIVELVSDKATKAAGGYLDDIGPRLASRISRPRAAASPSRQRLYFMPPYVITEAETAWVVDQIADVLTAVRG